MAYREIMISMKFQVFYNTTNNVKKQNKTGKHSKINKSTVKPAGKLSHPSWQQSNHV